MENLLLILLSTALLLLCTTFIIVLSQRAKGEKKQQRLKDLSATERSKKALSIARRFAGENNCQLLAPATLSKNGRFADLDFILAGSFGLLCVKCIGMGGEIFGSANDDEWVRVHQNERTVFENPLRTAAADTRLVRDCLFDAKIKGTSVETICIFTNPSASLALPRSTGHYTLKTFRALLDKEKYRIDKKANPDKMLAAISTHLAAGQARP